MFDDADIGELLAPIDAAVEGATPLYGGVLKRQVEVVLSVVKGNLTEMRIWDHFLEHVARSRRLYLGDYLVDWNFQRHFRYLRNKSFPTSRLTASNSQNS